MAQTGIYRTRNGNGTYKFTFRQEGSRIEVDIEATPSYGGRSTDAHSTHTLPSRSSGTGKKICFGDPDAVRSMEQAKRFAQGWAESTQDYIEKGRKF